MVERGDADQGVDAAAIGGAQFGQFRQQRGAEDRSHAGDGLKELVDGVEVIVGVDELADLPVEFVDLLFEGFEDGVDGLEGRLAGGPGCGGWSARS